MAPIRPQAPFRVPLLDSLLGAEERLDGSAQALRDSVRRDLEMLFNTRPRHQSAPNHLTELHTSILSYGMPDLQTRPMADDSQRDLFRAQFESLVRRFEPRLKNLAVEMAPVGDELDRSLRFRIRAILHTDLGDEPIVYDTLLDPATRNLTIADIAVEGT
jgi:type VI secretion system protein ImpF